MDNERRTISKSAIQKKLKDPNFLKAIDESIKEAQVIVDKIKKSSEVDPKKLKEPFTI